MKQFDLWNKEKKKLAISKSEVIFFEREVWLISLGQNIGRELNGKRELFLRPVIIYRKYNSEQCFILPLSTKGKQNIFYFDLSRVGFLEKRSFVCLSQGRVVDKRRFFRKLGKVSVGQFLKLKKSAQALLEPQSPRWL